jgi:predicted Zn-dependent protease
MQTTSSSIPVGILLAPYSLSAKAMLSQIAHLGDWVGLRLVHETTHNRSARDGKPEENLVNFDRGAMVEVVVGGSLAYAGTSDLSPSGILRAAQRARNLALAGLGHQVFDFKPELRPEVQGRYQSPLKKNLSHQTLQQLSQFLTESTLHMKISAEISSAMAAASFVEAEFEYVTTSGTHIQQNFLLTSSHFGVVANRGTDSQMRSLQGQRGLALQAGIEAFEVFGRKEDLAQVAEEALELLSAPNCPSKTCDLLLMPNQMLLQIHESIGHPLEMDRILGDERNFAGWSFVQPEDFGCLQYGSKLMNVTFDPTVSSEFASYGFDEAGTKATKEYLIREGRLERGLGGLESQSRLNKPGVANFRAASWNRAPIDRMANINLEAGATSLKDMIASIEDGMLMEANISWSIDDYRNKFQFGCEVGRVIKNGELKGLVKNPNYRGVTVPFWTGLKAVGRKDEVGTYGTPYCGKGEPSQVIRVGHAAPPCVFGNVEIFGGGQ